MSIPSNILSTMSRVPPPPFTQETVQSVSGDARLVLCTCGLFFPAGRSFTTHIRNNTMGCALKRGQLYHANGTSEPTRAPCANAEDLMVQSDSDDNHSAAEMASMDVDMDEMGSAGAFADVDHDDFLEDEMLHNTSGRHSPPRVDTGLTCQQAVYNNGSSDDSEDEDFCLPNPSSERKLDSLAVMPSISR